jgi:ubiquinone/menaquinone biosynthesis C-methylase UbiE
MLATANEIRLSCPPIWILPLATIDIMHSEKSLASHKNTANHKDQWVKETRFGKWFLSTQIWYKYVLTQAGVDLTRMLQGRGQGGRILDAGCGEGLAFDLLERYFKPTAIVGIDIDKAQISKAEKVAATMTTPTQALHGNACTEHFASDSFDVIFSHQLLHHTSQQQEVLAEFRRILKPGGLLLVGESCVTFIKSLPVQLLFRHPNMAQKDAPGYVELVRSAGFTVNEGDIYSSRPWWSRRCLGIAQKCGINKYNAPATEILLIAKK